MHRKRLHIAITGAAGSIAYQFIFAMLDTVFAAYAVDLRLLDLPERQGMLQGIKMELEDCTFDNLACVLVTDDASKAFADADWIIMLGAFPRHAGMQRQDLLQRNGSIFSTQAKVMNACAAAQVQVVVVGNPCNTNAMIASHHAPRLPVTAFTAMMMLDQLRAHAALAAHVGCASCEVRDVIVWGNHSSSVVADASQVRVQQLPYVADNAFLERWIPWVQLRGADIIAHRGASSSASAARALLLHIHMLLQQDTDIFSMAVCSQGAYGSHAGTWVSLPHRMISGVRTVVHGLVHTQQMQTLLQATFQECAEERAVCRTLSLL